MGGIPQLIEMLGVATAILATVLFAAYLVSKFFETRTARKRVIVAALLLYAIGFVSYFGFIALVLSGRLN